MGTLNPGAFGNMAAMALQQADLEFLQARKSFDFYYNRR
jgi:hypothetical protein